VLTTVLLAALAAAPPQPACTLPDDFHVKLEVAVSEKERELGLMFRDNLPADEGMIFLFPQDDRWPFWMKNTFIPLDLIWLDDQGRVVDLLPEAPPCQHDPCPSYAPRAPARAVLELNGGAAAKHDVKLGSTLRFEEVPGYPLGLGARR
jgi:uncharacterized membrane protein (UPF0127 family)